MAGGCQGRARATLTDARRQIDSGEHHVQATRERLIRGDTHVFDSLVRVAESFSGTFPHAGPEERAAVAERLARLARKRAH